MVNWFDTLYECLESEGLLDTWECTDNIGYGEHFRWSFTRSGKLYNASIVRDTDGRYERPIWY